MKTTIETFDINYIDEHLIKFNKMNSSVQKLKLHKIIVSNKNHTLVTLLYDNEDKIYLSNENVIISILNTMNRNC